MKLNAYARKKRQFENLSKKVNMLMADDAWGNLKESTRNALINKLRTFYYEVRAFFSKFEMKKVLAGAALLVGLSFTKNVNAQTFIAPVDNPFSFTVADSSTFQATFGDIDNDGDLDMFTGEGDGIIGYYENTGTATAPVFGTQQTDAFGLVDTFKYFAAPVLADIDNDGDLDMFVGEYFGAIQYLQNTGTASAPVFAKPVVNPFGLDTVNYVSLPELVDIDNDGDLDMFVGEYYGAIQYFQNTGSASAPAFAAPVKDPFGIVSTGLIGQPSFVDIDGDGDQDLFFGDTMLHYFVNTGTSSAPDFSTTPVKEPFGLNTQDSTIDYVIPSFVNLDGDGDFDMVIWADYGVMKYYENTTAGVGIKENSLSNVEIYPNPSSDKVRIDLSATTYTNGNIAINVVDLAGRSLKKLSVNSNKFFLNVQDLASGIYMLELAWEGNAITRKLVVE